jgi:hypothetical protein
MAPNIARGMETARFRLSERQALIAASGAFTSASAGAQAPT